MRNRVPMRATILAATLVLGLSAAALPAQATMKSELRRIKGFNAIVYTDIAGDGLQFMGSVVAKHNVQGCEDNVPVKIQRKRNGTWVKIGKGRTDTEGSFDISVETSAKAGTYRAVAPKLTLDTDTLCKAAVSETDSIHSG